MVPLEELSVDYSYQRACINKAVVEDICRNFDVRLMRPIKVSINSMCILDGQHTAMACVRRNIKEVPVVLLDSSSVKEDAELFVKFNNKVNKVNAVDLFHARIAKGDPVAVAIDALLKDRGIIPVRGAGAVSHGIQGVATLCDYAEKNMDWARNALIAVDKLCCEHNQNLSVDIFKGMFWLYEHGVDVLKHIDRTCARLDKTRGNMSRQDVIIHEVQLKKFKLSLRVDLPMSTGELYGGVILEMLNKGLRTNKLTIEA